MTELHTSLPDEQCPIDDQTLGEMYRASPHGLSELIATVPRTARVLLAIYCYRRAHLASIGLVIAATCEKDDLTAMAGRAGATLFERSRDPAPQPSLADVTANVRRKISLASGPLRELSPIVEEED
jgi:hypothetical protein